MKCLNMVAFIAAIWTLVMLIDAVRLSTDPAAKRRSRLIVGMWVILHTGAGAVLINTRVAGVAIVPIDDSLLAHSVARSAGRVC